MLFAALFAVYYCTYCSTEIYYCTYSVQYLFSFFKCSLGLFPAREGEFKKVNTCNPTNFFFTSPIKNKQTNKQNCLLLVVGGAIISSVIRIVRHPRKVLINKQTNKP